ncbi:hypothetical protein ACTOXX_34050 [Streptomyces rubiginosohelvolus]|uniref:hypothetical protein n=1 Tax=Streptomyces rubiginosohelvolus TaxID=67362 RepID=UPI003F8E173E
MSAETLTRFRCDAPRCSANGIGHNNITPPDGWTVLKSTAHIPVTKDFLSPPRGRRTKALSYSERCYGGFSLHLCPDHPGAFDAHRPITDGYGYNSNVTVSCSCGVTLGRTGAVTMVGQYPSHAPEKAWFNHLPVELRWYVWRGERQWATRQVSYGITRIRQYRTEDEARKSAASTTDTFHALHTLVCRDTEGDEWTEGER